MTKSRSLAAVVLALGLVVLRSRWLPLLAAPLLIDESWERADAIAIVGGDRRYDLAAEAIRTQRADEVLLFEDRSLWIYRIGASTPKPVIGQRALAAKNVDARQITVLPNQTRNLWDHADRLAEWLRGHASSTVVVLVDRFDGREMRWIVDRTMAASAAERIVIVGLADRRFDESNWWQSRSGWKTVFNSYSRLLSVLTAGRPKWAPDSWDPDQYERSLRARIRHPQTPGAPARLRRVGFADSAPATLAWGVEKSNLTTVVLRAGSWARSAANRPRVGGATTGARQDARKRPSCFYGREVGARSAASRSWHLERVRNAGRKGSGLLPSIPSFQQLSPSHPAVRSLTTVSGTSAAS